MSTITNPVGSQPRTRYEVMPAEDGKAWIDVDSNHTIDDSDAYVALRSQKGSEKVDFADLKSVLTTAAQDDAQVASSMGKLHNESGFRGTDVVNGTMNFDSVSTYRSNQEFQLDDGKVYLTIAANPDAPYEQTEGGSIEQKSSNANGSVVELVKDKEGVLHWNVAAAPPPPPDPQALTEATCVQRDGVLHWLFPGERLGPGDKVVGNTETYADNLSKL